MKKITRLFLLTVAMVTLGCVSALAQPAVAAPTPPAYSAAKVISIFSDAFTNVAGTSFNPGWGQNTVCSTVQIAGVNTLKYANLNYQGTALATNVNAAAMNFLHLDVWSADETSLQITAISPGSPANLEKLVQVTPLILNAWNSCDIPLTAFTGVSMADVFQFKVVGSGGKTVYIQNLYFYDNTTTVDTQAPTAFTATKGAVTYNSVELLLNATDNSGAVNYAITYGTTTLNTGGTSGVQKSYIVPGLTSSTDYSFSVVATDATGNVAANNPIVVPATTAVGFAVPTVVAPVPTYNAAKVISIYSDTYTNVAGTNFNPYWNQTTLVSTISVGESAIQKYENFNYQGIELASDVNATGMNKLHIDVFTPNETSLKITPISRTTGDKLVSVGTLALNTWNSFDILLSDFGTVSMANIFQLKFEGTGGKIVYWDNLYFYNDLNTNVSNVENSNSVTCFPNPVTNKMNVASKSEISQVIVRSLLGQTVETVLVNARQQSIDLSNVSAGNYFITIKLANGTSSTQKIVKL